MIIVETCPKCGHDLIDTVIATYPPIPRKECPSCGWYWEGEPEQMIRVPFNGNHPVERMNGIDFDKLMRWECVETSAWIPPACRGCMNHPSNGGSGICNCTLGNQGSITC